MDMLLICRDALASSLIGNLKIAIAAQKTGQKVGVLFTGEALSALNNGTFLWPRELREQDLRLAMADNAGSQGIPITGRGEARQIDIWQLLEQAKAEHLPMYACPLWSALLGIINHLPPGIQDLDMPAALKLIGEAKNVIGSF